MSLWTASLTDLAAVDCTFTATAFGTEPEPLCDVEVPISLLLAAETRAHVVLPCGG